MTLTEASAKAQEVNGKVVGLCEIGEGLVSECLPTQTTCDFYGVKVCTGAAGGHLFYSLLL